MLEPRATAAAATRVTDEDLAEIAGHLAQMNEAATHHDAMIEYDIAFHHRIAQASGNELLASMLDALSSRTLRARVWRGIIDEGSTAQTLAEHHAIHQALCQGNAEVAYAAALMHVNTSEQWLRQFAIGGGPHES